MFRTGNGHLCVYGANVFIFYSYTESHGAYIPIWKVRFDYLPEAQVQFEMKYSVRNSG